MIISSSQQSIHNVEPTDDWTIEQLLQWCLQKSQASIDSKTNELVNALQELYDNAEEDIWELHRLVVQNNIDAEAEEETEDQAEADVVKDAVEGDQLGIDGNSENVAPINSNIQQHEDSKATSVPVSVVKPKSETAVTNIIPTSKPRKQLKNLFVEILTGPHEGSTYLLKPRQNRPCEIGRSKGKKFLQRGISLSKDSEVSTSHGKFECRIVEGEYRMFYTDTGSTNGTSLNGEAIEDNVPLELKDGIVLVFGESDLKFAIVDN